MCLFWINISGQNLFTVQNFKIITGVLASPLTMQTLSYGSLGISTSKVLGSLHISTNELFVNGCCNDSQDISTN